MTDNITRTTLWPEQEFSTAELVQLNGYMSQPIVKKYLLHLGSLTMQALATGGLKAGQTIESYMLAQCQVQGGLDVINKLLTFEYPTASGESQDSVGS